MSHEKNARPSVANRLAAPMAAAAALMAVMPSIAAAQAREARPLERIVVTANLIERPRRQIGAAVSVIPDGEIELRGYHSVADVLRTQPGIGVTNSGGPGKTTTLRIRGEESYRTLLLIDGVKAVDPSAPQVAPSFDSLLTTNDLERIEVLRGPQGFLYGADAGGVVNILTRTGAGDVGGRIDLEHGRHSSTKLDASLSGGGEAGDYFLSVTDLDTDGFNSRPADTELADDDGADNTTLHTKLGWTPSPDLRVQLVGRDIDASTMYDGCMTGALVTVHDCVSTTDQSTYKLSAEHDGDVFGHRLGYSESELAREDFTQGVSSFSSTGSLSRFEYTGRFVPTDGATLVYGLDFQNEEITSGDRRERDQRGYYFEYQGELGDGFFVSAGARYDDNEDFGTHTSARLSGAWVQDLGGGDALKYRASIGTGFRAPSLYEVAYNAGPSAFPPASGVDLEEETSRGYDLGVELQRADGLHIEATYFDQRIEDEIYFDLAAFSGYLQAPGESTSTGVELGLEAPVGERWRILANWTTNETEDRDDRQRVRRPENMGNLGVSFTAQDEALTFLANYRLSRDSRGVGGAALDDYEVLDLSLNYALSDGFELYARLENATDEDYEEVAGYNTSGRAAYGGVRLRFR